MVPVTAPPPRLPPPTLHRSVALATLMVLLEFLVVADAPAAEAAAHPRRILVIYSYARSLPWDERVMAGMDDILRRLEASSRPEVYEEFLDAARLGEERPLAAAARALGDKYKGLTFDAVFTESQQAAAFLFANPDLFPGSPRYVFHYAPSSTLPPGRGGEQTFSTASVLLKALETIKQVRPRTARVIAVLDRSSIGLARSEQLREVAQALRGEFSIEVWDRYTVEELLPEARILGDTDAILYLPVQVDRLGAPLRSDAVGQRLADAASVPVFTHFDTLLGTGIVGGYVVSGFLLGQLMGRIAVQGPDAAPRDQAEYEAATSGYYFDARALARWRIPRDHLPPGSALFNDSPSFLRRYWPYLLGVGLAFVLETLLLLALLRLSRQRRQALSLLAAERAGLEERIEARTAELAAANGRLAAEVEERSLAESRERGAAQEKAVLLKELQHRVKNSLAITASLVGFEATQPEAQSCRDVFDRIESRIAALADLYDILYEAEGTSEIDLGAYLGRIVEAAALSLGAGPRGIDLHLEAVAGTTDLKRALPLGLIVNELITDCLKHAFPGGRKGRIAVGLSRTGETCVLTVEDDGAGLPEAFDPTAQAGFGFTLISLMTDQLGGEFRAEREPSSGGARFTLRFPA